MATTMSEGVETEEQRTTVHELGCTQMQGYLFSPQRQALEVSSLIGRSRGGRRRRVLLDLTRFLHANRHPLRLKTLYLALLPQL